MLFLFFALPVIIFSFSVFISTKLQVLTPKADFMSGSEWNVALEIRPIKMKTKCYFCLNFTFKLNLSFERTLKSKKKNFFWILNSIKPLNDFIFDFIVKALFSNSFASLMNLKIEWETELFWKINSTFFSPYHRNRRRKTWRICPDSAPA